ncbi:MAG: glycoside hydrolase family 127 protein [Bryobacteraceae bacterium]|nr:glycoside hydrolase family 127 protein [Bryobacteraceae bacterium]
MKIASFLAAAAIAGCGIAAAEDAAPRTRTGAAVEKLHPIAPSRVKLQRGPFLNRFQLNRNYVIGLKNENLLQNFYLEAGLWSPRFRMTAMGEAARGEDIHWGWESPTCQLRGHFLGHWLSAAAYITAATADAEMKAKADRIVSELARVQEQNGGRWVASIPEKYLFWIAEGKPVWAPHYTVHKTFMGLIDMYNLTGNAQALEIAERFAGWFHDWTAKFTRDQMDDILDVETGGMLEAWADLYGITGKQVYLDLMEKYRRGRLFDALLAGKDPLTNKHANTTIPEAHGAARAYEATGDARWRDIAAAYWKSAVTDRGTYATGGQTSGEIWTPPFQLSSRLGDKNQEHCVVYNMIRLADYLFRWTGDAAYADYIEKNIYNGILAQQHPDTGMIAYFLPLEAGAKKTWGTPTNDFWCCHGSLVQAHSRHDRYIYYAGDEALTVAQYIPSELVWQREGATVGVTQTMPREADDHKVTGTEDEPRVRPNHWRIEFRIVSDQPSSFTLRLRVPEWVRGAAAASVNGEPQPAARPPGFLSLQRTWRNDLVALMLPKGLTTAPLADQPDTVAFMDGPVVLAGLSTEQRTLYGEKDKPASMLTPDNEREWANWLPGYRTVGQDPTIRFAPLHAITSEPYTVYFPVRPRK